MREVFAVPAGCPSAGQLDFPHYRSKSERFLTWAALLCGRILSDIGVIDGKELLLSRLVRLLYEAPCVAVRTQKTMAGFDYRHCWNVLVVKQLQHPWLGWFEH